MEPYVLAVASHKGGTGRTTAALMLAWSLGQLGRRVTLIDADEQRSATLIATDSRQPFCWSGVQFRTGAGEVAKCRDCEFVVIDPPALTSPSAAPVLRHVHGLILTCMADPLSIRTVPAAATVIEHVKNGTNQPDLLGILISMLNAGDIVQAAMMNRLQESHRDLLLEPAIPYQQEVRAWPLHPGTEPPAGPARDSMQVLAQQLSESLVAVSS